MTENKNDTPKEKEAEKVIFNNSARTLITSRGKLEPGKSIKLGLNDAKSLMVHKGIHDSASFGAAAESPEDVSKLRKEIEDLKAQHAAVVKERDELAAVVGELDADANDLDKQVKPLQKKLKK